MLTSSIGQNRMASICPGCGKKFGFFDRVAGVPLCLRCQKSGVRVTREDVTKEVRKTDLITGWCLVAAAAAFIAFVLFVPSREGAPPNGKLRLIGYALIPLGAGSGMIASAMARMNRK